MFGRGASIDDFWRWFAREERKLGNEATGDVRKMISVMNRVTSRLQKTAPGLHVELQGGRERTTLIISCEGVADLAPTVTAIVGAAPPLTSWTVVAFRQRDLERARDLTFGGARPYPLMFFDGQPGEQGRYDLRLVIRAHAPWVDRNVAAIMLVLDAVLGEYTVMTKIGAIEFAAMAPGLTDDEIAAAGLQPIAALAGVIDAL